MPITPKAQPKISIVMTTFDRIQYIAPILRSVLAQTRRDFEFLVWDDGSTDPQVVELLRTFERSDPRIKIFAMEHRGRFQALKAVFAHAIGDYLAFVDSDDLLAPTCLEETAAVLDEHPGLGWVYTDYVVMDAQGKAGTLGSRCKMPYSAAGLLVNFMTFHFRMMRRDAFERAGGIDDQWGCAGDYDLCVRLSEVADVIKVPKPLYFYRVHSNAISSQRRIEQILTSAKIVERALERRGMSEQWRLEVEVTSKFSIKRKGTEPKAARS
jgi:glycosyltransferase involved in cell wall biosynthesis